MHEELKKICERELSKKINNDSKSSKDKYKKFCTDSVQTVKGKLIKKGVSSFISQESGDEDWKTVFATNRSHNSFIKWIDSSGINSDTKIQEGYSALKNRCNTELSSTNSTNINRVEWWCTIPEDKTIGDLINKEIKKGKKEITDWSATFNEWKGTEELIKLVNSGKNDDNEKIKIEEPESNKGKNEKILEEWCKSSKKDKLGDEEIFDKKRNWIINVCLIKND